MFFLHYYFFCITSFNHLFYNGVLCENDMITWHNMYFYSKIYVHRWTKYVNCLICFTITSFFMTIVERRIFFLINRICPRNTCTISCHAWQTCNLLKLMKHKLIFFSGDGYYHCNHFFFFKEIIFKSEFC